MKRNILKATLVAAVALVASVTVYNAQKPDMEMSDAALANVEALASGEVSITGCQPNGGTCVITIDNTHIVKDDQHP